MLWRVFFLICDGTLSVTLHFLLILHPPTFSLFQHRGGVRPSRGRRGHVQSEPGPAQEPEGAGGGGEDHTSQPRDETRDLVRPDHQLVDLTSGPGGSCWAAGLGGGTADLSIGTDNLYYELKSFL